MTLDYIIKATWTPELPFIIFSCYSHVYPNDIIIIIICDVAQRTPLEF
jgi:hypothetical protein